MVSAFLGRGVCTEDTILIVVSGGRLVTMSTVVMRTVFHDMLGRFATVTFETGIGSDWSVDEGRR